MEIRTDDATSTELELGVTGSAFCMMVIALVPLVPRCQTWSSTSSSMNPLTWKLHTARKNSAEPNQ
eukprot:1472019-Amphidinium_carterae.1